MRDNVQLLLNKIWEVYIYSQGYIQFEPAQTITKINYDINMILHTKIIVTFQHTYTIVTQYCLLSPFVCSYQLKRQKGLF